MNSYFHPLTQGNAILMVFGSYEERTGSCDINSKERRKDLSGGSHTKNFEEDYCSSKDFDATFLPSDIGRASISLPSVCEEDI